jgi:hypothetical protein
MQPAPRPQNRAGCFKSSPTAQKALAPVGGSQNELTQWVNQWSA